VKTPRLSSAAVIGAMWVVYWDIGTSPLYALEASLTAAGAPTDRLAILGVLSLIFWSLLVVVTIKYVVLIMRADNEGEGGILSLFALVQRTLAAGNRWQRVIVMLAALGAALFYCDALITPAISVLSAVEGLQNLSPDTARAVVPVTLVIMVALFSIQSRGTERVGRLFGPIMLVWFLVLAVSGLAALLKNPSVLVAMSPSYALLLLVSRPGLSLGILGGVFLAMTGGEALYADMGHFGKKPVRVAWFTLVWPALVLNYFGQGAMILGYPAGAHLPLYQLVPTATLPLMVLLATAATIIASQATITGAFSVTRQCIQLDLLPRLRITQTSAHGTRALPDLRAGGELVRHDRGVPVRAWLSHFGGAGRRVRRGGRGHHVHHHAARHAARGLAMALEALAGRGRVRSADVRRSGLSDRQHDQVH
jgi:KUP system potassium uptake protein